MSITGPADLRDRAWLDERVSALGDGIQAARDIWSNWFDGRGVGRFHPGLTAGQYIASLGMRLSLPEAMEAMPDASTREVAAVAGVSDRTVGRARGATYDAPVRGADGKTYPPRIVRAVVIDEPTPIPFRVTAQAFERDIRRLADGYREFLGDERFAARYGAVIAAIDAALEGDT